MPHQSKQDYRVEALIERGLVALGETIDYLATVPMEDRDHHYVRALSDPVLAAVDIAKEERAAIEFLERHKFKNEDLQAMVTRYLQTLPPAELDALMANVKPRPS
jgi:hypothetical protein